MAKQEHLNLLEGGADAWNDWLKESPDTQPDLEGADLSGADLSLYDLGYANLKNADLSAAFLRGANLAEADLSGAELSRADFSEAVLNGANLTRVTLSEGSHISWTDEGQSFVGGASFKRADLSLADLSQANLKEADLSEANLSRARLIKADLSGAVLDRANMWMADLSNAVLSGASLRGAYIHGSYLTDADMTDADLSYASFAQSSISGAILTGATVYGISTWDLDTTGAEQSDLVISLPTDARVTVDNLEIAQFVNLLLDNRRIRDVIDTVGKKMVLILGRFTPERKQVLDAIRQELRKFDLLPMMFDFDVPESRDMTETVTLLARLSRFIIADLTEPSSLPKELEAIVPTLAVPVKPILEKGASRYSMFSDYWKYDWVLKVHEYEGLEELLASLGEKVIAPAESKVAELYERRRNIEREWL